MRKLIRFSQNQHLFQEEKFWDEPGEPDILWHGVRLGQPDWGFESHSLAFELNFPKYAEHLYVMLNAYWEALDFELPLLGQGQCWQRVVDTFLPSPQDFSDPWMALPVDQRYYSVQPRSAVILAEGQVS